jgi:hypothetical protein
MLAELLGGQGAEAARHPEPEKFPGLLRDSSRTSAEVAAVLASAEPETARLDQHIETLRILCRDCHKRYRDEKR